MGRVTDHLIRLLETQVKRHGLVVWYDPQAQYAQVVEALTLPDAAMHRYHGSFFELRYEIEPYLVQDSMPHLVVYVDLARSVTEYALAEVEAAGVVLEAGSADKEKDTGLKAIGRAALSPILSQRALDELLRNESLTLADLDRTAMGSGPVSGVLSLIFGTTASPSDIALRFMAEPALDEDIAARSAQDDLIALFAKNFGFSAPTSLALSELRTRLVRHILLNDFRASLPDKAAAGVLISVPGPENRWQVEACQRLAARWRDSVQYRTAYKAAACLVEQNYQIDELDISWQAWKQAQTFPCIEALLLQKAEEWILEHSYTQALTLAEERQNTFWSVDENALRWTLIRIAASLLMLCAEVKGVLETHSQSAAEMVKIYSQGAGEDIQPWCELDTLHRKMERLHAGLASTPRMDQIVANARQEYTSVVHRMSELFGQVLGETQFQVAGVLQQIHTFREQVAPRLQQGRVAYLWLDALRFEMAHELLASLSETGEASLIPALAAIPTLTAVGMAALLPGAERGLELVEVGGQLASEIDGQALKVRGERVQYLTQRSGYAVEAFTLEEVLKPSHTVRERIRQAQLIVVTAQEIDSIAESQPVYLARSIMDDLLIHIRRVLYNLAELDVATFVITSDHGFLFGDELRSDMLIEPPDGHLVKLTQRVWIGRGGSTPASCLRVRSGEIGVGGDLEFVFPPGLAGFRVRGGADPYCHGGLSLQELVVPVITARMTATEKPLAHWEFSVAMDRPRIMSRVFTVAASYEVMSLFDIASRRVRCVALHEGTIVAHAVAAAYGYDDHTGEVVLKRDQTNYITLMMTQEITVGQLTVLLVDPETEAELARLEGVEVEIAI